MIPYLCINQFSATSMIRDGFEKLQLLPSDIRKKISEKYGSLEEYYFEIFYLEHEVYKRNGSLAAKREIEQIRHIQLDFEDELEDWGIDIADEIISDIASDYSVNLMLKRTENISNLK